MPIPQFKQTSVQSWRSYKQPQKNLTPIKRNKKKSKSKPKLRLFSKFILLPGLIFFSIIVFYVSWLSSGLPEPGKLIERDVAQSTKIYDRTGQTVLYDIHGEEQRTLVNINDLPDYVKQATIAIEDKNFYNHKGISLWGIFRGVVWRKLQGKSAQGGSTLTQQFVKNAILTSDRTVERKIKEWVLAYRLEQKYSKEEILQLYLNEIPYGSTAYGIEAASQKYLGKEAKNLSIAEAATLAALPQSPSRYSPYGSNVDLLMGRKDYVIEQMAEQGYITEEEENTALAEEIIFKKQAANIIAPHFVMYVKEYLSEKYGEKTIEQGGFKIFTTLDLYKQEIAEEIVKEQAEKNEEKYQASNAALVSIDPKTGQILTMIGSKDFFSEDIDGQVNITTSLRQPGSSIKPLVYAALFLKGYTPDTILYDVVTNFSNDVDKPYEPHNYDLSEHGPISIRKALAGSLNIPAVKALYLAGIDNVLELAQDFGYTSLNDRNRFGLSLVLGGAEVRLLEHTNAFGAFAREGIVHPVSAILKIEDSQGNVLEEFKEKDIKALDPKIARTINNVLSDNNARAYAFGQVNWLTLDNRPVAAKTGTTNDYRDAWTIGYTPSIVTGVWVGNNDNTTMKRGAAGGVVAAPIWNKYMEKILGDTPVETFKDPEIEKTGKAILDGIIPGVKTIRIDKSNGFYATEFTPFDQIKEITFPDNHSILYYVDKDNPLAEAPEKPENDSQFELWESRVLAWSEKEFASSTKDLNLPEGSLEIHNEENKPSISIISPQDNTVLSFNILNVNLETSAKRGVASVSYLINNNFFTQSKTPPFNLNQRLDFLPPGYHTLTARACDDVYNCSDASIKFSLSSQNNYNQSKSSISLLSPQSGLALNKIDFPLNFSIELANYENIAKIELTYINTETNQGKKIAEIIQPKSSLLNLTWLEAPASGTYKIILKGNTWTNLQLDSKEIYLIINNDQN